MLCWEQASPSLETGLEGTGCSARASPGPEFHQPALHGEGKGGEQWPSGAQLASTSGTSRRAGQGRKKGREGERLAKEEGPGGGSLIQTLHR